MARMTLAGIPISTARKAKGPRTKAKARERVERARALEEQLRRSALNRRGGV